MPSRAGQPATLQDLVDVDALLAAGPPAGLEALLSGTEIGALLARAARLVEDMEKAGLVSAMSGSGQREILVPARAE